MKEKIVIALGGNAIQTKEATAEAQQTAIRRAMQNLKPLFDSPARIVISHGNGPQIGSLLIQQAKSNSDTTPAMPLDTCGAMSQGMIGYWLETEINRILTEMNSDRTVGTIVTRVEVDKDDPRFNNPTKPIGPFYTKEEVEELQKEQPDSVFKEDAGRGYRKVVASPLPQSILEYQLIRTLADGKNIVIACGGGGIPVIKKENTYEGVEAVIDKDFASEKLATLIEADTLMILTNVENVFINFNEPNQQQIDDIDVATLKKYAEQGKFAEGSMLPKIEAAIRFVESGENKKVIITNLEQAYEALIGNKGTHIHM
ncbi:TPA: carbamate kinase [Staphylococcus aureus]|uniref:carbamate kinase n=1 Tax=Staphylococcus aureus TaxID=1280 RepID=UPI001CECC329|nr:carbamate kinase [Staphylococcus aureus]UCJ88919.1 carbamate kinase [Staphylococcus aureus]UCJ96358.1 carbamate kinase [Staphylococcus aureus]UCJ98550.1 carbamate kinase [Staphylococcus aureus]HDA2406456.1 carbamate kinase [Staphylococcus aureus]HDA2697778.1 carbamate kinase [Staphylococcus aureus]